ncbi:thiamine diphosphokinase [Enterococcus sp. LJL99]
MEILLVAGGNPNKWPLIDKEKYDYFVGIDRGSLYLIERDWPLDLAVGDFDSLSKAEYAQVVKEAKKLHTAQSEKDDTDTQLALALAFKTFPEAKVTIIGATGGRIDHFLANLWLPLEPRFQPYMECIRIKDHQNTIDYYEPGTHVVTQESGMNYLAYVCLTPVTNLTLRESKYLLNNECTEQPTSFASNEFIRKTAKFSFESGTIAVIQSKDK